MSPSVAYTAAVLMLASLSPTPVGAEHTVTVSISTVVASNDRRSFDPRLEHIRSELKPLRFKNYRMLGQESRDLTGGDQCGIELPGGRYLHITTKENTAEYLRMNILLNEGNRPIINTDVKLDHDSVVVLGGPKDERGTLLITIGTETPVAEPAVAEAER